MKIANAIAGGTEGALALGFLQQALQVFDGKGSKMKKLDGPAIIKRLKKVTKKNGKHKLGKVIRLAGDVFGALGAAGITPKWTKRNAILKGGLLGAAAGIGSIVFAPGATDGDQSLRMDPKKLRNLLLFTLAGVLAGMLVRKRKKKRKK